MKPVLLSLANISPLACLAVFALAVLGVGVWLAVLRHKQLYARDHLVTGLSLIGMVGLFLFIIYRAGVFEVKSYGAMLVLGFIAGTLSGIYLGRRRGVATERVLDLGLVILIGSVIGARAMYLFITPNAGPFLDFHQLFQSGVGGLSFHGGLLGGILASAIYVSVMKLSFWRVADSLAPSIAVGYAITRIGCFLNGCCYGKSAPDLPWAVTFPHSPDGLVAHVHPTQIYASLMAFAMFGLLLWLARGNGLGRAGRLFMVFMMLEGVERFVMEIFRQPAANFHGVLTAAQGWSIVLVLAGVLGWFLLPKRPAVVEEPNASAKKHVVGAK